MLEVVEEDIRREVAALEEQRRGGVLITVGKVLLWMDLVLACFVYAGLRVGSHLFLWWVLGEGLLGLLLMAAGSHDIADARGKLARLTSHFQPHN
jgi:pheromone shutdown protein TraB